MLSNLLYGGNVALRTGKSYVLGLQIEQINNLPAYTSTPATPMTVYIGSLRIRIFGTVTRI